jgi:hypothetical protein
MHGVSIFPENGNILQNSHIYENKSIQVMFSFFFYLAHILNHFQNILRANVRKYTIIRLIELNKITYRRFQINLKVV